MLASEIYHHINMTFHGLIKICWPVKSTIILTWYFMAWSRYAGQWTLRWFFMAALRYAGIMTASGYAGQWILPSTIIVWYCMTASYAGQWIIPSYLHDISWSRQNMLISEVYLYFSMIFHSSIDIWWSVKFYLHFNMIWSCQHVVVSAGHYKMVFHLPLSLI